jgi:serine phosphatase RsbU (regulator of sigma subunit)
VLVWVVILLLFGFLYVTGRRSILSEIRRHAMGVAISVAAGLDAGDLEQVRGPGDTGSAAFRRVQDALDRVVRAESDVRYLYTMRRSPAPDARETDYEYVVDASAYDQNRDGILDDDEQSEAPGNRYDASDLPEMVAAWRGPSADPAPSPDPPYPDLLSGYAPVRDARGRAVAIVGADITAATVKTRLLALRVVILAVWLLLSVLTLLVVALYYRERELHERNVTLTAELSSRNELLRAANAELARNNEQFRSELRLAQSVQLGFLPKSFPRPDRVVFDKYYLTCDMLGGDLFDVFPIDDDRVGLYIADVAGHGVSAALISGLLKMAVASLREQPAGRNGRLLASVSEPHRFLHTLNGMIVREIPEYEFVTMVYAVLDVFQLRLTISAAGHPPPLRVPAGNGTAGKLELPPGMALGLVPEARYTSTEVRLAPGDKLVFYTDGLTETMNDRNEEFSEERLIELLRHHGGAPAPDVIATICSAVNAFRGARAVTDDFSMLIAQIR